MSNTDFISHTNKKDSMFIRTKKVKDKNYAYLVENYWNVKSKQRVVAYLGRVYTILDEHITTITSPTLDTLFLAFIKQIGFKQYNSNVYALIYENKTIYCTKKKIWSDKSAVCIKVNDGFLCDYTMKQFWQIEKDCNHVTFATTITNMGIMPDKQTLIEFFFSLNASSIHKT